MITSSYTPFPKYSLTIHNMAHIILLTVTNKPHYIPEIDITNSKPF